MIYVLINYYFELMFKFWNSVYYFGQKMLKIEIKNAFMFFWLIIGYQLEAIEIIQSN